MKIIIKRVPNDQELINKITLMAKELIKQYLNTSIRVVPPEKEILYKNKVAELELPDTIQVSENGI